MRTHLTLLACCFLCIVPVSLGDESIDEAPAPGDDEKEASLEDMEDAVLTLTSDNFDQVIESSPLILVEFYAPWCGHCKQLAPEYESAAVILRMADPPIPLAKVDATVEEELGRRFGISGYPTLKVFHNGVAYDYDGPRDADGIVKYMEAESSPDWAPPINRVLTLTSINFTEVLESTELVMVEFYAPWCGHCKELAPKYEKAATMLYNAGSSAVLAKIDATAETLIATEYNIEGYPTLKVFRNGRFSADYSSQLQTSAIVQFMMKQAEPSVTPLVSRKELETLLKDNDPVAIGFFDSLESPAFLAYSDAAGLGREEPIVFKYSQDPALASVYKASMNSIAVFLPWRHHSKYERAVKPYTGSLEDTPAKMFDALKRLARPLVGLRTSQNTQYLYTSFPLLVGFVSQEDGENAFDHWRHKLLPLAKKYPEVSFAISDDQDFAREIEHLGLAWKLEDIIVVLWEDRSEKYLYEGDEVTTEDLDDFIEDFKAGKLRKLRRSQPIPSKQSGPVVTVVGDTFDKIVMNPKKSVLLLFGAPWCGECKNLEPVFKKLAKKFKKDKNFVVAKFDATANEAPMKFAFQAFPTIFFVPAGKDKNPDTYEGAKELQPMIEYVERKLSGKGEHQFKEFKEEL